MNNEPLNRSLIYPFTHLRIHSLVNQIDQSMQNKPNFHKNRMIVSSCKTKDYENAPPIFGPKIPNPISPSVQMNLSSYKSMNYEPRTMNYPWKNKANSNPKQTQFIVRLPALSKVEVSNLFQTDSEISINKSFKQPTQQFHRQAHHVCQAAFNPLNKFVARFFYGISARLIPPGAAFDMLSNLLISHFLRVNSRAVAFDDLDAVAQSNDCNSGYNFVRSAEELSRNLLCLFGIGGLADYLAVEIHNGIGTNDKAIGMLFCDVFCLGQSQPSGVFIRQSCRNDCVS